MKLIDALRIANQPRGDAKPMAFAMACGFTPLHLKTFLHAELQQLLPHRSVQISTGLYGDIPGTLASLDIDGEHSGAVVIIEWPDIDPRLGTRQLGGWGPGALPGLAERAAEWLALAASSIKRVSQFMPVAVCTPTLPLPPLFFTPGWQTGRYESALRELLARFSSDLTDLPRLRLISQQRLDLASPGGARMSIKSDWTSGFPYENAHASALANLLAKLLVDAAPKKGLITDLDDTLWQGIVGDAGVEAICWDLDNHAQAHGFYQQFLRTLADEGTLIGVASKNDPAIVEKAFERTDLLLPRDRIFPFEVSWGAKSAAVGRILSKWNIAADSVVFLDDNEIELAEVAEAHPGIECILFPSDAAKVYELCQDLRDKFGRQSVSEEDALRMQSLRTASSLQEEASGDGFSESLLEGARAELTLKFHNDPGDSRSFELVNKTNQFNLNGRRYTEAEWTRMLAGEERFALTVGYTDRFGALGKISVLAGRVLDHQVEIDTWVLSCRAFARRIEYQCLRTLFRFFDMDTVVLHYAQTQRNGPTGSFLTSLLDAAPAPDGSIRISRSDFESKCPNLFHKVNVQDEARKSPAAAGAHGSHE